MTKEWYDRYGLHSPQRRSRTKAWEDLWFESVPLFLSKTVDPSSWIHCAISTKVRWDFDCFKMEISVFESFRPGVISEDNTFVLTLIGDEDPFLSMDGPPNSSPLLPTPQLIFRWKYVMVHRSELGAHFIVLVQTICLIQVFGCINSVSN